MTMMLTLPQLIALGDLAILSMTMWAEGRGDSAEGHSSVEERIAIGCVIRNRVRAVKRFDSSYVQVCLAPRQFSCWAMDGGALNNKAVIDLARQVQAGTPLLDPLVMETQYLAQGILADVILDRTNGSLFYVTAALAHSSTSPLWVKNVPSDQWLPIGAQLFTKNA